MELEWQLLKGFRGPQIASGALLNLSCYICAIQLHKHVHPIVLTSAVSFLFYLIREAIKIYLEIIFFTVYSAR